MVSVPWWDLLGIVFLVKQQVMTFSTEYTYNSYPRGIPPLKDFPL